MMEIYKKSLDCFHRSIKGVQHIEKVKVPYENSHLPGYFVNASRHGEKQPVVVIIDGLHGTAEKNFFMMGKVCRNTGFLPYVWMDREPEVPCS